MSMILKTSFLLDRPTMPNVLLLRTPSESPPDPYESTLQNASYKSYSLPVLETSYTNVHSLQTLISMGPQSKAYAGVIITSKRSCEAWVRAAKIQLALIPSCDDDSRSKLNSSLAAWRSVPFYVVGEGTASALQEFRTLGSDPGMEPRLDIRGQDTGTGERLAHFILKDIAKENANVARPLLYLTGDKNRDAIPKFLSSTKGEDGEVGLDSLQVYETHGATSFERNLDSLMAQSHEDNSWWIVVFAPSSSQFAFPTLLKYFRFITNSASRKHDATSLLPVARVAAIGRVTSTYLEEELNLRVDAVAAKPSPETLLSAMSATLQ